MIMPEEIRVILIDWSEGLDQEDIEFYEAVSMTGYTFTDADIAKVNKNCNDRIFRAGHRAMREMFSEEELAEYASEATLVQKWVLLRENVHLVN